jgi:hypothetical protein
MRRRDFIKVVAGSASFWPLAAHAQQAGKLPTIGFLGASPSVESQRVAAFVQRLRELAWIDGRKVRPRPLRVAALRPRHRSSGSAGDLVRGRAQVLSC